MSDDTLFKITVSVVKQYWCCASAIIWDAIPEKYFINY